jgi:hypothetical protein
MPHIEPQTQSLPFSGSVRLSRHCSYEGAKNAEPRASRQALALLQLYAEYGPLTDAQAASWMHVERSTVCARRNELVKRSLVKDIDTVKGDHGIRNVRWGLLR